MKVTTNIKLGLVILFSFGLIFTFFNEQVSQPNDYIFNSGGDAIKNYYTPLYYIHHDGGYWFDGMLYPYGEHVVFTDNQPLLSWVLNIVDDHVFSLKGHALGIFNMAMLIAQLVTCVFIFLILNKLRVTTWIAIVFSVLIGLMAPQLERMLGHYALSYSFFVPMIWYFLLDYFDSRKWLPLVIVVLLTAIFSFIHVYYLALSLFLTGSFFLVCFITRNMGFKEFLITMLVILIPVVIFKVFLWQTDPVSDRPESPFGYFALRSDITSVFLPNEGPVFEYLKETIGLRNKRWEGFAYVGLTTTILVLFSLVVWIGGMIKKSVLYQAIFELPKSLKISLPAGCLVFLFSMAFPFRLGLHFLWDYMGPIQQLRSTGRFAWVFYFVITVFSVLIIDKLFKHFLNRDKAILPYGMVILFSILWLFETTEYLGRISKRIPEANNARHISMPVDYGKKLEKELGINFSDYQAIIGLPFYIGGTEGFYVPMDHGSSRKFMELSLASGLPLVNSSLSRTSFEKAYRIAQVVNHPRLPKGAIRDMPSNAPLLIAVNDAPLSQNYKALINRARYLGSYENCKYFTVMPKMLRRQKIDCDQRKTNERDAAVYSFATFEREVNEKHSITDWRILHELDTEGGVQRMEYSCWIDLKRIGEGFPDFKGELVDGEGNVVWEKVISTIKVKNLFNYWSRIELDFPANQNAKSIRILTNADEALIGSKLLRNVSDTVAMKINSDKCLINNFPNWSEYHE